MCRGAHQYLNNSFVIRHVSLLSIYICVCVDVLKMDIPKVLFYTCTYSMWTEVKRAQFLCSGLLCFRKMIMYSHHELREGLTLLKRQQTATLAWQQTSGDHEDHCSFARTRFAGFCRQRRLAQDRKPQAFSFHFSFGRLSKLEQLKESIFCSTSAIWYTLKLRSAKSKAEQALHFSS